MAVPKARKLGIKSTNCKKKTNLIGGKIWKLLQVSVLSESKKLGHIRSKKVGAQDVDSTRIWAQRESESFTDYFLQIFRIITVILFLLDAEWVRKYLKYKRFLL